MVATHLPTTASHTRTVLSQPPEHSSSGRWGSESKHHTHPYWIEWSYQEEKTLGLIHYLMSVHSVHDIVPHASPFLSTPATPSSPNVHTRVPRASCHQPHRPVHHGEHQVNTVQPSCRACNKSHTLIRMLHIASLGVSLGVFPRTIGVLTSASM